MLGDSYDLRKFFRNYDLRNFEFRLKLQVVVISSNLSASDIVEGHYVRRAY